MLLWNSLMLCGFQALIDSIPCMTEHGLDQQHQPVTSWGTQTELADRQGDTCVRPPHTSTTQPATCPLSLPAAVSGESLNRTCSRSSKSEGERLQGPTWWYHSATRGKQGTRGTDWGPHGHDRTTPHTSAPTIYWVAESSDNVFAVGTQRLPGYISTPCSLSFRSIPAP